MDTDHLFTYGFPDRKIWRSFATPLSDSRRAHTELPSTTAFKDKWLQDCLSHNDATTPHHVMDLLERFPLQCRATTGGLRRPGKLYLDRRVNLSGFGPLPDMPAPEGLDGPEQASSVSQSLSNETAACFRSYNLLKGEKRVHRRLPFGPTDLYTEPVSAGMMIGWKTATYDPKRLYVKDQMSLRRNPLGLYRGRSGCDETKYAEALILGPRHA